MRRGQSARHGDGRQDAAKDIIYMHTVHLGFGSQSDTVPQTRQRERFDVVGVTKLRRTTMPRHARCSEAPSRRAGRLPAGTTALPASPARRPRCSRGSRGHGHFGHRVAGILEFGDARYWPDSRSQQIARIKSFRVPADHFDLFGTSGQRHGELEQEAVQLRLGQG